MADFYHDELKRLFGDFGGWRMIVMVLTCRSTLPILVGGGACVLVPRPNHVCSESLRFSLPV